MILPCDMSPCKGTKIPTYKPTYFALSVKTLGKWICSARVCVCEKSLPCNPSPQKLVQTSHSCGMKMTHHKVFLLHHKSPKGDILCRYWTHIVSIGEGVGNILEGWAKIPHSQH